MNNMLDIKVFDMVDYQLVQIELQSVGTMVAWTFFDQMLVIGKI
jgi:hypothetical protein